MRPPGIDRLSVLLAGTLLLCHGIFGALHLVCDPPVCAGAAEHPAGHELTAGAAGVHEHPADHGAGTGYFAVVAGLLGLLLGMLPRGAPPRVGIGTDRPTVLRRASAVFRPARAPTLPTLQVFRL